MKPLKGKQLRTTRKSQAGLSLLEMIIALAVLLVVAVGVMGLAAVAMSTTENQGHLMARTAEYAQDKMEQLLALKYCDADSDTTTLPTTPGTGKGLAGCPTPLVSPATGTSGVGGSSNPNAPVAGYVDYLDESGNLLATGAGGAAPANWRYIRVWQISSANASNTVKQVAVTVKVSAAVGKNGVTPRSTLVALKAYPF
jgi:prepilin-type N-terminal cleavage/methylation domain-containing protein